MVDINLLKNTKGDEPGKQPKPIRPPKEYSAPPRERLEEKPAKPPAGFIVWLKRLFSPKPKPKPPFKPEKLPAPRSERVRHIEPPTVVTGPPDIFAELDRQKTPPPAAPPRPPASRRASRVGPGTTAAKPANPPLPRIGFLVNLLPEELSISPVEAKRHVINLVLAAVICVVVVLAVYLLLDFYQTNYVVRTAKVEEQLSSVESDIGRQRATQREAIAFADQVKVLKVNLEQHIYWSRFFKLLEKYTVTGVAYAGAFKGDVAPSMTLSGTAASIEEVAHQLVVFSEAADEFVVGAKLEALSRAESLQGAGAGETYTFAIGVSLAEGVFRRGPTEPAARAAAVSPGGRSP